MRKIFLASEAKHLESMKKLEEFVGGLKGKKIAYIPTAANGEEPYGIWIKGETYNLIKKMGAKVIPVVLEDYKTDVDNTRVLKLLKGKDIIWFAGGTCGYLMYWVRRFEIEKNIRKILDSGTVYVGSSAGSMVCARTLDTAVHYLDFPERGVGVIPGFGLINFHFYPHYDDVMFPRLSKIWKGEDLYLVKNGEAITITGNKVDILGEKRILRDGKLVSK
jgi:dipeptidase E